MSARTRNWHPFVGRLSLVFILSPATVYQTNCVKRQQLYNDGYGVSQVIGGVVRLAPADSARSGEGHVTRHYRLWNDCSRRYVQMIDSTVNAQGHSHSPFGECLKS